MNLEKIFKINIRIIHKNEKLKNRIIINFLVIKIVFNFINNYNYYNFLILKIFNK